MPSSPAPKHDPTPVFARQLIGLYAEVMADVRFPDLDLARLRASEKELLAAQLEVERCEALLEAARATRDSQAQVLNAQAERALAYAQIFAAGNAALTASLSEVGRSKLDSPVERTRAPKRARSMKKDAAAELFANPEDAQEAAAE